MKRVLLLALLVVLVAAVTARRHRHDRREEARERLHEYRVVNQNLHLDMLEKEIEELEEEFEEFTDFPTDDEIAELRARLHNLENETCDFWEDGEVECGGEIPQCVSHLFICDGHDDCNNGRDEDDFICTEDVFEVGFTITGVTKWHDCFVHEPHNTVITIVTSTIPEAYPSRAYVKAVVSMEVDEETDEVLTLNSRGYYNPGRRALVLRLEASSSTGDTPLAVVCRFIHGNNEDADCSIGMVGSKHECASFFATTHKSDDEEDDEDDDSDDSDDDD